MTAPEARDEELMTAASQGAVDSLGLLFERHAPSLRAFFLRRGFDSGGADDRVQDVFLRVLRYRASWRGDGPFSAWLWRFAVNVARDAIAHQRARPAAAGASAPTGIESMDGAADPALAPIRLEEAAALHSALARLAPEDRAAIELRWFHGGDTAALAERFGCSPVAARVRLHRAMVRLRALQEEER